MTFCICQINLKSLHTLIIIYTTPNLFFFSKNLPCLCSSPCIYILLTNVLRASDLDTNTIQCSIFIYCWSEWVRERGHRIVCMWLCTLTFYAPRTYIFKLIQFIFYFFSGANFNISIDMKWKNFFFIIELEWVLKVFCKRARE